MARIIWALLVKSGTYRTPAAPAQADHDRQNVRVSGDSPGSGLLAAAVEHTEPEQTGAQ